MPFMQFSFLRCAPKILYPCTYITGALAWQPSFQSSLAYTPCPGINCRSIHVSVGSNPRAKIPSVLTSHDQIDCGVDVRWTRLAPAPAARCLWMGFGDWWYRLRTNNGSLAKKNFLSAALTRKFYKSKFNFEIVWVNLTTR